jgi:hypothetical protein
MKTLHWDSVDENGEPYRYGNPNLTWDGILEPGDAGYVAPDPIPQTKQPKSKTMRHQDFYPNNKPDQIIWLENLRNKIANHAAVVGINTATCNATIADARWLIYVQVSWLPAMREWAKSCTEALKLTETSTNNKMFVLPVFVPPAPPAAELPPGVLPAVIPVKEGALDRIFTVVQLIKDHESYTDQIGVDLGIIGAAASGPDWATLAPVLKVAVLNGHVFITWGWGGFTHWLDACEIQVDRGNGWENLVVDTTPNYIDTAAFPTALIHWKYRAIFNVDGARKGNWSNTVSLAVG